MNCIIKQKSNKNWNIHFTFNIIDKSYDYKCELEIPKDKDKLCKINEYWFLYYRKDEFEPYYERGTIFEYLSENIDTEKELSLFNIKLKYKDIVLNTNEYYKKKYYENILKELFQNYDIIVKATILSQFNEEPFIHFEIRESICLLMFKINGKFYKYELDIYNPECGDDDKWNHYYMKYSNSEENNRICRRGCVPVCCTCHSVGYNRGTYIEYCDFFNRLSEDLETKRHLTLFDLDVKKEFVDIDSEKLKQIFYDFNTVIMNEVHNSYYLAYQFNLE